MKRFVKGLLITVLMVILLLLAFVVVTFPPIMGGMAAKTMCSCVFLTGRDPASVMRKEMKVFPGMDKISIKIDAADSTVETSVLWHSSRAIYRKGLGCTLLAEAEEAMVRQQQFSTAGPPPADQRMAPWPQGNRDALAAFPHLNHKALNKVVTSAFIEPDSAKPIHTHAVVVVYRGKIIAEQYAPGFHHNSRLMGWSMTKSITNALVGILVGQGALRVEDPAPVHAWQEDARKQITYHHLLHANSGLSWSERYFLPWSAFHRMFIHSDDKAAYAASRPLEHEPGTFWEYSSGTTNILSSLIRQQVGDSLYHRFPYENLFYRIGMHHAVMEPDASGTFVASSYGFASARDWARLGLLYLQDGVWNGARILPAGWVSYSITPAPGAGQRKYGAQVWLNLPAAAGDADAPLPGLPPDAFFFNGFEENMVVVIPSREAVIVRLGVTHHNAARVNELLAGICALLPDKRDQDLAGY